MLKRLFFLAVVSLAWIGTARADIRFEIIPIENSSPILLLKGAFSTSDNPELLAREVATSGAKLITFNSGGGNVVKAMAYGRTIRSLGLSTLQLRAAECASACALAFLGGVSRQAEPGSIGVHQASFSPDANLDGTTAVAAVQVLTAQIINYLIDMDVDPKLLQLSLSVSSQDMRYLTAAEMEIFKVTHSTFSNLGSTSSTASAVPASPHTTSPSTPTHATPEQKAAAFITSYHDAWSSGNFEALTFMDKAYAETVNFYGKATAKAEVLGEKKSFANRWPVRAYSVKPGSLKITCAETCKIEGVLDWFTKRIAGNKTSSGSAAFSLVWDHEKEVIMSENGKVIQIDTRAARPAGLISQWEDQNSACRGGRGDLPETDLACERREAIGAKLDVVGWCYGREGEFGYQMQWHQCQAASYKQDAPASTSAAPSKIKKLAFSDYPVLGRFSGETVMPDFKGRDRAFTSFRTRIREGLRNGPNFAGRYSLIQIGCGTGCSFVVVANNQTGRPVSFPRGGEKNMYLSLDYRSDSRLVTVQWLDSDKKTCVIEFFDFDREQSTEIDRKEIGGEDACYRPIAENLQ